MSTKIEWTEATWNPLGGCSKVSDGCKNCYAIRQAYRIIHMHPDSKKYAGTVKKTEGGALNWTGQINLDHGALSIPLKNKKPTRYFVNSMSDLFHDGVPFSFIDEVYKIMAQTKHHTYQILTKRADRMLRYYQDRTYKAQDLPNVWLGVSVEDQKAADERIPHLLQTPAAVRWLSCEPLLGPINFRWTDWAHKAANQTYREYLEEHVSVNQYEGVKHIDWVVVGGESGHNARPMHPDWARSLRDQCKAADVPFFFKQWGEWYTRWYNTGTREFEFMYHSYLQFTQKDWVNKGDACISIDGTLCKIGKDFMNCAYPVSIMQKVGKKKAGRLLDGQLHDEYPKTK